MPSFNKSVLGIYDVSDTVLSAWSIKMCKNQFFIFKVLMDYRVINMETYLSIT